MILRTYQSFATHALDLVGARRTAKGLVDRLVRFGVPRVRPQVLRTLPHDDQAFTQGILYRDGLLYESTGTMTRSSLRCLDPRDGRIRKRIPVEKDFAEGIAAVGDLLYQLSWRSGKARLYHMPELTAAGELNYEGEGWGLTSAVDGLIMSNGSSRLQFRNTNFHVIRELRVTSHGLPIRNINDIEYANGFLYANIWHSSDILEICLKQGQVTRVIDGSELVAMVAAADHESVMNGIAYNPIENTFFLTGKNWKLLFEVAIGTGLAESSGA